MTIDEPTSLPPPLPPAINRRRWWIHLILIGGYFAIHIPLAFFPLRGGPVLTDSAVGLLVVTFTELALFSLFFTLGCLASKATAEDLLLPWRPGYWVVPLGIGYSVAIRIAVAVFMVLVMMILVISRIVPMESIKGFVAVNRPNVEKLVDVSALQNDRAYYWIMLTVGSFIVAGLREEIWRSGTLAAMRALWPNKFAGRTGEFVAVMLIAVVFGAGHLTMGIIAAILAGVLGICLGVIMVVHRSIWPAVIAHGVFDATTFALLPQLFRHLP